MLALGFLVVGLGVWVSCSRTVSTLVLLLVFLAGIYVSICL